MASDELALLEILKRIYTNKTVYLRTVTMQIVKVFAMGEENAVFYGFVYERINYKLGLEYDEDEEIRIETELEKHIMTYLNKEIVVSINSIIEHILWREHITTITLLSKTPYYE
jgi:uncharacterized oligopeptide transporter (OPT) family protein